MKPRIRKISNLYFRFGKKLNLGAEEVALILEKLNLIERIGQDKYREIREKNLKPHEYQLIAEELLHD